MNPAKIFQLKASWDRFAAAHPKFPLFLRAVSDGNVMQEGTIAEITITTADGRKYEIVIKSPRLSSVPNLAKCFLMMSVR
mgnify:CR=1 FL=1